MRGMGKSLLVAVTKEGQENEEDYVTDHGYQETTSCWM